MGIAKILFSQGVVTSFSWGARKSACKLAFKPLKINFTDHPVVFRAEQRFLGTFPCLLHFRFFITNPGGAQRWEDNIKMDLRDI
jgi:hypothetical protein